MVLNITAGSGREYPAELVQFATAEAERDAVDVVVFLTRAGLAPLPSQTRGFPLGILLDLGAVVRLRRWEAAGYAVHMDAGLPSARAALDRVIDTLVTAATTKTPTTVLGAGALARSVFEVTVTRFAWGARPVLGTDIALDANDEDTLVEVMAQFLWPRRHSVAAAVKRTDP